MYKRGVYFYYFFSLSIFIFIVVFDYVKGFM